MSDLADILTMMSQDIDSLKEWRKTVEAKENEGEAEQAESLKMFNDYMADRRQREAKEAADLQALKDMMM